MEKRELWLLIYAGQWFLLVLISIAIVKIRIIFKARKARKMLSKRGRDETKDIGVSDQSGEVRVWTSIESEDCRFSRYVPYSDFVELELKEHTANERADIFERANFRLHEKVSELQAQIRELNYVKK